MSGMSIALLSGVLMSVQGVFILRYETDEPVGIVCFVQFTALAGLSGSMDFHGSE